jgi:hypothetical protein
MYEEHLKYELEKYREEGLKMMCIMARLCIWTCRRAQLYLRKAGRTGLVFWACRS